MGGPLYVHSLIRLTNNFHSSVHDDAVFDDA